MKIHKNVHVAKTNTNESNYFECKLSTQFLIILLKFSKFSEFSKFMYQLLRILNVYIVYGINIAIQ